MTFFPRHGCLMALQTYFSLCLMVGLANSLQGANLIAHWNFNEGNSPYFDCSGNGITLFQDPGTTTAITGAGIEGTAPLLDWHYPPGISTRLFATNTALFTDSFGFSFWLNPSYLNQNDNLIAKEMAYNASVTNGLSWQVQIGTNNGSSTEPIELIVYGDNRTLGSFYGDVVSVTNIPLHVSMTAWIHVAGGYDSTSGILSLFVNGMEADSTNGVPGANNSDGSAFDVGTAAYGTNYIGTAAETYIDDLQIYNGPLMASDVAFLMANPGHPSLPYIITALSSAATNGDIVMTFNSTNTATYNVEASTNLTSFMPVATPIAVGDTTTITIPKASIDAVFGTAVRPQLYFRVSQLPAPIGCN